MISNRSIIGLKLYIDPPEPAVVQGYLFDPSEKEVLLNEHASFNVYQILKAVPAVGGHYYLANSDKDFNPKTTFLHDKGHSQLIAYFLTDTCLEKEYGLQESGDRIIIGNTKIFDPDFEAHQTIDDIPDYMFLTSWLAAGNVFMPGMPDNFEKWLNELGVSLDKRIRIMNFVSLRGVELELFDSALKHHLKGMDEKCRNKASKHFNKVREWIKEVKMRK